MSGPGWLDHDAISWRMFGTAILSRIVYIHMDSNRDVSPGVADAQEARGDETSLAMGLRPAKLGAK